MSDKTITTPRPSGSNADEWYLFLEQFLENRANGNGTGLEYVAVQIATALDELLEALKGVVRIADRKTVEFDAARAAIAKADGLNV